MIAHDFVEAYGGAERVLGEMLATFPRAPLWVVAGRRSLAERIGASDRFNLLVPERSWLVGRYRSLAPVYPLLTGARRLPAADVLLTSSFAYAHRLKTANRAPQVCLCHGPLRFAWTQTEAYGQRWAPGPARARAFRAFAASARRGDRRAAAGVDRYLVFSEFVERQIREFYGREATRIKPPLDCETFRPGPSDPSGQADRDGFYLFCGRLAEPSKRPTIVVEAFRSLPGERLLVAGDGPALPALRASAPENVEFLGHLEDHELIPLLQGCEATVFPSREDLGLIPAGGERVRATRAGVRRRGSPGDRGAWSHRRVLRVPDGGVRRRCRAGLRPRRLRSRRDPGPRPEVGPEALQAVDDPAGRGRRKG